VNCEEADSCGSANFWNIAFGCGCWWGLVFWGGWAFSWEGFGRCVFGSYFFVGFEGPLYLGPNRLCFWFCVLYAGFEGVFGFFFLAA